MGALSQALKCLLTWVGERLRFLKKSEKKKKYIELKWELKLKLGPNLDNSEFHLVFLPITIVACVVQLYK
jgi:hypothetical protein